MSDRPRMLVAFEPLPERETAQERIAHSGTDVREAMALVDRRLLDKAMSIDGYIVDVEFEADTDGRFSLVNGGRTVVGRLRLVRL